MIKPDGNKYWKRIRSVFLIILLAWLPLSSVYANLAANNSTGKKLYMPIEKYLYDENHTRFQLVKTVPGNKMFNWFFLPGGPGVDSNNLMGLIEELKVPGNYWLIDLPGNGTNTQAKEDITSTTFEHWDDFLVQALAKFENPVLVGHSFAGYLPFFCPKLEKILKGLIIIGSASTLQSDIYAQTAKTHSLPDLNPARQRFMKEKTLAALQALYMLEAVYFFAPEYRTEGINKIIKPLQLSIPAEYWWYTGGVNFYNKDIPWVPKSVPTLIMGGSRDYITPLAIFKKDSRFQRKNIKIIEIENAGHFPWLEKPNVVNETFTQFAKTLK